MWLRTGTSGGL